MERAIAEMEKIKRAEEIYSRRKSLEDDERKQPKSIYKTLFEILFLINVIIVIVAIQNQKYIFTESFIKQVNSYNINIKKKVEELFSNENKNNKKEDIIENNIKENTEEENKSVSGESNDVSSALVENQVVEEELSQEEKDIIEIKNKYAFIMPVEGIKTSGFGDRESSNSKVTKYHTGVDIGASKGTIIYSAISGKVIQVSEVGDYGKHIKIQTDDDLVTLYAHCSKIYVQEGQEVIQGDEIGEVGSTGNSTGPHLHFEIRLNERYVNPEKILEF